MSKDLKILCSDSYLELSEDRYQHFSGDNKEHEKVLKECCTLYVGNLSFSTTKEQIFELFSMCGNVRNVFMGLDKIKKMTCGFCFLEYHNRTDAENAMSFLNRTILDDYIIHRDWDLGFREARQYGCGQSGDQVRDKFHENFDAGRGDFGKEAEAHDKRGIP